MTARAFVRVARLERATAFRAARWCRVCRGVPLPVVVWESRLPGYDHADQPRPDSCPECGAKAPIINIAFRKRGDWEDGA